MDNTFGERIKELRIKANTTQKELAEKLEISPASIIAYEKGQKTPSLDVAMKFARYFKSSLDSLCGGGKAEKQYKSFGDIARTLCTLLKIGNFNISINTYEDSSGFGIYELASITPSNCWDYGTFVSSADNEFLIKYNKMVRLLKENTLSQEIFDTWLESELSNLDKLPLNPIGGYYAETKE